MEDYIIIGTWIMALGTCIVAVALIYQTRMTQKQLAIMEKDRARPTILEFLGRAAFPLYNELTKGLNAFKKREFNWSHKSMESLEITMIDLTLIQLYAYKFPRVFTHASIYNSMASTLNDALKRVDKIIYTPDFERKCREAVIKFNRESPKNFRLPKKEVSEAPERILRYVINNEKELPKTSAYYHFWEKHGTQFLKIREKVEGATQLNVAYDTLDRLLIPNLQKFNKELDELSTKLMREYHITVEELRKHFKEELSDWWES